MSTPPLFRDARSLVDADVPDPPTNEITELDEMLKRLGHLIRFSPKAPGMRLQAPLYRDQYALVRSCSKSHGHSNGQHRVAQNMVLGRPLHHVLQDATSQELRRVDVSRGAGVWVLRDGEGVKQQFGGTLWKKAAQSKNMTLAWSRCFVTGRPGDSSEIQMHHEHVKCLDILVAPVHLQTSC